jgi:BTB/POZ domain-containing protein 7
MYHDALDLRLIDDTASAAGVAGASCPYSDTVTDDPDEHAMNLYEIGRFLEFTFLSLGCEDLLMQHLSASNVIKILEWSLKPHGSAWISRQAFLFLEEEFFAVASSEVLAALDIETLTRILQSDFIQASEAEILQALIRWGECQLNSRATKDPSSTSSGVGVSTLSRRRESKRREVCESELKELLAPLFPFVRFPHVLPRDKSSEVLDMVRARNLYPVLPNFTSQISCSTKYSPWDPRCSNGWFVRPRLFIPYFEECKNLIQDRCAPDPELISSSSPCVSHDREGLYTRKKASDEAADDDEDHLLEFQSSKPPDKEMMSKMLERLKKLLNSFSVQRSLSVNFIEQHEIVHLVELRVVREFNLPDNYVNILRKMRSRCFLKGELVCASSLDLRPDNYFSSSEISFSQPDFFRSSSQDADPQQHAFCGPDVTLATTAMSSLTLHRAADPDSPDLVGSVDGSGHLLTAGNRYLKTARQKRLSRLEQTSIVQSTSQLHPLNMRRYSQTSDQLLMSRSFNSSQDTIDTNSTAVTSANPTTKFSTTSRMYL